MAGVVAVVPGTALLTTVGHGGCYPGDGDSPTSDILSLSKCQKARAPKVASQVGGPGNRKSVTGTVLATFPPCKTGMSWFKGPKGILPGKVEEGDEDAGNLTRHLPNKQSISGPDRRANVNGTRRFQSLQRAGGEKVTGG